MLLNSVTKKLLWGLTLPGLVILLAGIGTHWRRADTAVREASEQEAFAIVEWVTRLFALEEPEALHPHRAVEQAILSNMTLFRHVASLRIIDRAGVVRWSREPAEVGRVAQDAERLLAARSSVVRFGEEAQALPITETQRRAEVIRELVGPSCTGCHEGAAERLGVLQLEIDEPALRTEVTRVFRGVLVSVLAVALGLALALALSLHFVLTRPLTRLTKVMRRAEEGDLLARADARRDDEIGRLGRAFNRLLARITSMKAAEIDSHREIAFAQEQLTLKQALEETNAKLEHRLTELSTLYDVARSVNATLRLPEILKRITQLVPERLQIHEFSIMLLSPEGRLEVKAAYPERESVGRLSFELGEGACGRAAEQQQPVYIPDVAGDESVFLEKAPGSKAGRGSLLSVPMIHRGNLLGVMNFERPEKAAFASEELEYLAAVADQLALAVRNAQLHEETVALSITDPLTGVPNRRHLFSRLELELARAKRFGTHVSLLMVDIDHFKKLNDAAGHRAGDSVLKEVAALFRTKVRRIDTLARYGGEEFMLILPQVTKGEAMDVAEKLRRAIEEAPLEYRHVQPGGRVTISVGVSSFPLDSDDLDRLVDSADSALYASKRLGRNKVSAYVPGMELHPGRERGPHVTALKSAAAGEPGA